MVTDERRARLLRGQDRARSGAPWDNLAGEAPPGPQHGRAWLAEARERPRTSELRFDAIGVIVDRDGALVWLDHLEGAF